MYNQKYNPYFLMFVKIHLRHKQLHLFSQHVVSLWVMQTFQPGWQCGSGKQCEDIEISGTHLKVDQGTAASIGLLRDLVEQYAPEGQSFIVTPFWPGAYPLFERKAPMWEIFALFPRSQAFEQAEIERIKAAQPAFAFILDIPLDGRDELRFRNTHPLINQYILDNFDRCDIFYCDNLYIFWTLQM